MLGESIASYASTIPTTGSLALGALYLFLAELAMAISARERDLVRVNHHLDHALQQFEMNHRSTLAARAMINWYYLSAISAKAEGRLSDYGALLHAPTRTAGSRRMPSQSTTPR